MEFRDLAYFQVIAESGHLGRAADLLGRTQPALTKCIRRLEASLAAQLFERVGRGLRLTSVGEVLLTRTRQMRSSLDMMVREVTDVAQGAAGHVRIGSGATTTEYLLPLLCRRILEETPSVTLEFMIGMSNMLRNSLREGQLDLVIGPLAGVESEFASIAAMEDKVVVVARRGHPLSGQQVKMRDLLRYRWVLPATTVAMRQWLDRAFLAQGLERPDVQIETNSISLLPRVIAETDLLSFISRKNLGVGRVGAPLREIPLNKTTMSRQLGVIYRADTYLPPAARRLIDLISSQAAVEMQGASVLDSVELSEQEPPLVGASSRAPEARNKRVKVKAEAV